MSCSDVDRTFLVPVARVAVLGPAAREVRATGRVRSRIGTEWTSASRERLNPVPASIFLRSSPCRDPSAGNHPRKGLAQPFIHADVPVGHDEDSASAAGPPGRAARSSRSTRAGSSGKYSGCRCRHARITSQDAVALLGARRHAGGGTAALHVDDEHRNFSKIGQPMNSVMSEMPGPEVAVKARVLFSADHHDAGFQQARPRPGQWHSGSCRSAAPFADRAS